MPSMCSDNGCVVSKAPRPISVVVTGMPKASANSRSASAARRDHATAGIGADAAPAPAAKKRSQAAASVARRRPPGARAVAGHGRHALARRSGARRSASLGMSTTTGPGRPLRATSKAVRRVASSLSASVTRNTCLAQAPMMLAIGASWKASVPMAAVGTWPQITTMGMESAVIAHRRHRVGGAGAAGDQGHAHLAGGARVARGHEAAPCSFAGTISGSGSLPSVPRCSALWRNTAS